MELIWAWVFSLIGVKLPGPLVPIISFSVFTTILIVGLNLTEHRVTTLRQSGKKSGKGDGEGVRPPEDGLIRPIGPTGAKIGRFVAGVLLYLLTIITFEVIFASTRGALDQANWGALNYLHQMTVVGFPIGYLLYVVKERRLWVLVASVLFLFMTACLLTQPLENLHQGTTAFGVFAGSLMLPIFLMAAILFSPLKQLTRRLGFVVLGVLTLVVLSEISQLNLHQYVKPPKVSANISQ